MCHVPACPGRAQLPLHFARSNLAARDEGSSPVSPSREADSMTGESGVPQRGRPQLGP